MIKRYDWGKSYINSNRITEQKNGQFVRHSSHMKAIAQLEQQLREADEAIVEHAVKRVEAGDGHGSGYECRHCEGWVRGEEYEADTIEHDHNEPCIAAKARARIEARKGKGD